MVRVAADRRAALRTRLERLYRHHAGLFPAAASTGAGRLRLGWLQWPRRGAFRGAGARVPARGAGRAGAGSRPALHWTHAGGAARAGAPRRAADAQPVPLPRRARNVATRQNGRRRLGSANPPAAPGPAARTAPGRVGSGCGSGIRRAGWWGSAARLQAQKCP